LAEIDGVLSLRLSRCVVGVGLRAYHTGRERHDSEAQNQQTSDHARRWLHGQGKGNVSTSAAEEKPAGEIHDPDPVWQSLSRVLRRMAGSG
ncbi:MAG TPA: hypothetical protein VII58_08435, partial [Acidobacteriaceae bacterium]